jgi:hypothetical protein
MSQKDINLQNATIIHEITDVYNSSSLNNTRDSISLSGADQNWVLLISKPHNSVNAQLGAQELYTLMSENTHQQEIACSSNNHFPSLSS